MTDADAGMESALKVKLKAIAKQCDTWLTERKDSRRQGRYPLAGRHDGCFITGPSTVSPGRARFWLDISAGWWMLCCARVMGPWSILEMR
ncbi:MAG: hypothetical protein HRT77_01370 [Halioglobus sp.]|nr:hypothetical protein [Halioglobus sp.]